MTDRFNILLLNGSHLNLPGAREPETHGNHTLADIVTDLTARAASLNVTPDDLQSNAEYVC